MKKMISRRNFLKVAGASAAAMGLAACGGSSSSTASSAAGSTAASTTASGANGKVYYLNFKPEQDQAWQDLAAEYTKETGVPVTVVTAASGQYETTLMSEMEKSEAPTLFQVNGPVGLANWKDYCYDLSSSKLYGELTSDSFALKDGDAVAGIAYVIETYGIIYNKELLSAAGYTQDDIKGFDDLKNDLNPEWIGLKGSPTNVFQSFGKQLRAPGTKLVGVTPEQAVEAIMAKLIERHII